MNRTMHSADSLNRLRCILHQMLFTRSDGAITKSRNDPQRSTTISKRPTTTHNDLKTTHNDPQRSQNDPQRPTTISERPTTISKRPTTIPQQKKPPKKTNTKGLVVGIYIRPYIRLISGSLHFITRNNLLYHIFSFNVTKEQMER